MRQPLSPRRPAIRAFRHRPVAVTGLMVFVLLVAVAVPALLISIPILFPSVAAASLAFPGLAQQPPEPSRGSMLNSVQRFLSQVFWLTVFPRLAIFLHLQSFEPVGHGLRAPLDRCGRR
jgi:peptide/nickel transport system permease protein